MPYAIGKAHLHLRPCLLCIFVVHGSGGGVGGSCVGFWRGHVDLRGMKQSDSHFNRKILAFGAFFWQFATVYNSSLCISRLLSDVKRKHLHFVGRSAWNGIRAPDPLLNMEEGVDSSAGTKWISHSKIQKSIFNNIQTYMFSWQLRFPPRSKWIDLKSADNSD